MAGMNKKAVVPAVLGVIIVIIVVLVIWNYAGRECSKDTDCGNERYCGSDFKCHEFKIIQKTEINNNFMIPAIIVGIAIIIAAIVLRGKKR
jgi:hypothetical protein